MSVTQLEFAFVGQETSPSLLKWTGSKRSQASRIWREFPSVYNQYLEPFLGGGAIIYGARRPAIAADIYAPLIEFWVLTQTQPDRVVADYEAQWTRLQQDLPGYFYEVRARFNRQPNGLDLSFLMRTCVNGIARFNSEGEFNNSFHLSRKGMLPKRFSKIVNEWHARIKEVDFLCQDYEATCDLARPGDLVYLDPPYAGNKQRYVADLDIDRLFHTLERLNSRGVKWALSFDGQRGENDLSHPVPSDLYKHRVLIPSGYSAVGKVLNESVEVVHESLYRNY